MTAHELMVKTNHYLIKDGVLTEPQKANIVRQLLAVRTDERTKQRFYKSMEAGTETYPAYYIPPYNKNKKLQTVIPMSPKTHILSMNAYELDILRLLFLFALENPVVTDMVKTRLEQLKYRVCFGGGCIMGECFHSTLPVLRLINTAAPYEKEWMHRLAAKINNHIDYKYKENSVNYYLLCLSELPYDIAKEGLERCKNELYTRINKSVSINTERAKTYQPVLYYVYRNCLSRFDEYEYIKNRQPFEKNGRLYFDMNK